MARIGFVGGAYKSIAYSVNNQSCINLMAEKDESGAGKAELILIGTPGLKVFATLSDSPLRGEWRTSTPNAPVRVFAVSGSTLYEVFSNGTSTALGTVANDGKPASMASSSIQLMIASGGQAYCYTFSTGILTGPIATIAGVTQVIETDGFFVAVIAYTAQIFVSPSLDGINWDPAQTAIVSVFPDNIVSLNLLVRQVCLLGTKKSVCYYDSGNLFPFDVVPGGTNEQGSAAIFGTTVADNTILGIWQDERGGRVAFRAQGYTFQRITTHAIELAWQSYSTVSDAVCYSYQERGHTFVVWNFPSAAGGNGRTWVYDIATGLWHERAHFVNGVQYAHRSICHMLAFEKHLVGDPLSGTIYEMAESISDGAGGWNFADDFGNPIIRERTSPYFGVAGEWNYIDQIEVLADTGQGPEQAFLSGGTGLYDSTLISSTGGTSVPQFSVRVILSPTGGDTYTITGSFKNVGANPVVISIYDSITPLSSSITIAPGSSSAVSLSIVGGAHQIRYGIGTANAGDSFDIIGFNPTAQDATTGAAITINSQFAGGAWSAFGSGATVTVVQNAANPLSTPRGPQLMLTYSKDGGNTWSNERQLDMGQIGNFKKRLISRNFGRFWGSTGMLLKTTYSDAAPIRIVDLDVTGTPDMKPQKRLAAELRERA
jgi:hypothetical protein